MDEFSTHLYRMFCMPRKRSLGSLTGCVLRFVPPMSAWLDRSGKNRPNLVRFHFIVIKNYLFMAFAKNRLAYKVDADAKAKQVSGFMFLQYDVLL